jgi:hypothetical protein
MVADAPKAFPPTDPNLTKFSIVSIFAQIRGTKPSGLNGVVTHVGTKLPLENAKVSIVLFGKAVVTQKDGRFDFTPLTAGTYDLQIEAEGFETVFETKIEVKTGVVTRLNVKMVAATRAVGVMETA